MIHVIIQTPEGVMYDDSVYEVIVPTVSGPVSIFRDHTPMVSVIVPGVVTLRPKKNTFDIDCDHYAVGDGGLEVNHTSAVLAVSTAEHADNIDELRAKEALARAKEAAATARDHLETATAYGLIERNTARLKVAEIKRHRRQR